MEVYSPSIEEVMGMYDPGPATSIAVPDPSQEIVALATAVFDGVQPRVFSSHKLLTAQLASELGGNLWMPPEQERMPFPDALLYAIASVLRREKATGRKADWILWVEDDVVVPKTLFSQLRKSADPVTRPFVACVGHDRYPPFKPAVWDMVDGKLKHWSSVPESGVIEVGAVGLTAALFHRSLFDRIPQPWFGITARVVRCKENPPDVSSGIKPDMLWSMRLREMKIPILVDCSIPVTHMGMPLPVNTRTAAVFREMHFMDREYLERMSRGQLESGDSGAVPSGVRQDSAQALDGAHETSDAPGEDSPAGEPGYFLRP